MPQIIKLPELAIACATSAQMVSPGVRMAGGAGLALLLHHRRSDDVDLFCPSSEPPGGVASAVERRAVELGATATRVRTGPSFVRLEVVRGSEMLRIDVVGETAPPLDALVVLPGGLRVESLRDQRANKIVALLGRSELRDLVDLYFLEQAGFPTIEGMSDAVLKDTGTDPAWFAWAIDQVEIRELHGLVAHVEQEHLRLFRDGLRLKLLDLAGA